MKNHEFYDPPIDILQKLIEHLHENYTIDMDVLTDYIITGIFAAVHTTSTFLTNTLHRKLIVSIYCILEYLQYIIINFFFFFFLEYANHPEFHKELLEEQEELLKSKNRKPFYTSEQIDSLVKLDSFFKETLRMTTSIVFLENMTLNSHFTFSNGYQVPKGNLLFFFKKKEQKYLS